MYCASFGTRMLTWQKTVGVTFVHSESYKVHVPPHKHTHTHTHKVHAYVQGQWEGSQEAWAVVVQGPCVHSWVGGRSSLEYSDPRQSGQCLKEG